ncbi:unnamed protein product [Dicrocoelium dendriticum]|nr:unnamed protein product [Dicrocoelium dendriticum]
MRHPCTLIQQQIICFRILWHLKTQPPLPSSIFFFLHLALSNVFDGVKFLRQPVTSNTLLLYHQDYQPFIGKVYQFLLPCAALFCQKFLSKYLKTENTISGISDTGGWSDRPVIHTVESIANFGFGYRKSTFGILCILLGSLSTCESVGQVRAKPMSLGNIRPYSSQTHQRSKPPRVFMPPLDLGFRGQTPSSDRGVPLRRPHSQNYQSDQSASNNWYVDRVQHASEYKVPTEEAKSQYSKWRQPNGNNQDHSGNYYNLMGAPPPQSRFSHYYYDSHGQDSLAVEEQYADASYNSPSGRIHAHVKPSQPHSGYVSHDLLRVNPSRYEPQASRQMQSFRPPDLRSHRVSYENQGQPMSNDRFPWYGSYPHDLNGPWNVNPYPQGWQNNPTVEEQVPYAYHRSDVSPNAVGHPSNYQPITEDEVSVRLKEYREEERRLAQLNIPTLPPISEEQYSQRNTQETRTLRHDNGFLLVGNAKHDQVVQNFRRLASGWTLPAVEALFDEIDTNRDGVIKVDELRNFLWLHEVLVPG